MSYISQEIIIWAKSLDERRGFNLSTMFVVVTFMKSTWYTSPVYSVVVSPSCVHILVFEGIYWLQNSTPFLFIPRVSIWSIVLLLRSLTIYDQSMSIHHFPNRNRKFFHLNAIISVFLEIFHFFQVNILVCFKLLIHVETLYKSFLLS